MRFCAASDRTLLVYLGEEVGQDAHEKVLSLLRSIETAALPWLQNLQPAYCSLLLTFDPAEITHHEVEAAVRSLEQSATSIPPKKSPPIDIPVCYGGEFGPDLQEAAALLSLSPEQIIELHSSTTYRAYFLGFAPGFAYLGDLPSQLELPRLATPRKKVPPGSVAITGKQTGVYPFATPGGWRLIGKTPLKIFDPELSPMNLISLGDQVRFRPVSMDEFLRLESA